MLLSAEPLVGGWAGGRDPWYVAYVVMSRINQATDTAQHWLFRRHVRAQKARVR